MQAILDVVSPERVGAMALSFAPKALAAVLVFVAFWLLVRLTQPALRKMLQRAQFAEALVRLLVDNVYRFAVLGLGLVMAVSQLGVNVAAALAGFGVAGIAVGFAAQDSIANVIAGFLIFWDKPFLVGQWVTTQGRYGQVTEITMRTTRIRTPENTYVVLPNRQIIQDVLVNHSLYGHMRVNVPLGIAYKERVAEARAALLEAVRQVEGVLADPAPDVVAMEFGGSSVNLHVRVWIDDAADERPVYSRTLEACKVALDKAGIQIPYPHLQLFVENVEDRVWERAARLAGSRS